MTDGQRLSSRHHQAGGPSPMAGARFTMVDDAELAQPAVRTLARGRRPAAQANASRAAPRSVRRASVDRCRTVSNDECGAAPGARTAVGIRIRGAQYPDI